VIPTSRVRQQVPVGGRPNRMATPAGTDAVPTEGGVGAVTDSNLPRPGGSGLAWVRELHAIPVAGKLVDSGTRVNPTRPIFAGSIRARDGHTAPVAIPDAHPLADPSAPTTADVLRRFVETPDARHHRLYNRLPDVGGSAPWQGIRFKPSSDRDGGIPIHPAPLLHGLDLPDPRTVPSQGTTYRGIRSTVAAARRALKPVVRITPGLGGLDAAQSVRAVPDAPSGAREAIRDLKAKRLRGVFIGHRTAPETVVETLAMDRAAAGGPTTPPVQESNPLLSTTTAAPNLSKAKAVPTEPVAKLTASTEGEPQAFNFGFLAVAAVALLIVFKS